MKDATFDPPGCRTTRCAVEGDIILQLLINVIGCLGIAKGFCPFAHLLSLTEQSSVVCGDEDRRLSATQLE